MKNKRYTFLVGDREGFLEASSEAKAIARAQLIAEDEGCRVMLIEGADAWDLHPTPVEAPVEPPSGLTDVSTHIQNWRASGAMGFNGYATIEPKTKVPAQ